jgi:hypothetical protein
MAFRDPGGSMYCPEPRTIGTAAAFEATYSYTGQPLASDEYHAGRYTFQVYFRPDELASEVRTVIETGKWKATYLAEYFMLHTDPERVHRAVIDESQSKLCEGNFVDGNWTHTDPALPRPNRLYDGHCTLGLSHREGGPDLASVGAGKVIEASLALQAHRGIGACHIGVVCFILREFRGGSSAARTFSTAGNETHQRAKFRHASVPKKHLQRMRAGSAGGRADEPPYRNIKVTRHFGGCSDITRPSLIDPRGS